MDILAKEYHRLIRSVHPTTTFNPHRIDDTNTTRFHPHIGSWNGPGRIDLMQLNHFMFQSLKKQGRLGKNKIFDPEKLDFDEDRSVRSIKSTGISESLSSWKIELSKSSLKSRTEGKFIQKGLNFARMDSYLTTSEDIVQGIPKIKALFEARRSKQLEPIPNNPITALETKFYGLQKRVGIFPNIQKLLQETQISILNRLRILYFKQGVFISDRHFEVILRQMGQFMCRKNTISGVLEGEVVPSWKLSTVHEGQPGAIEPQIVGITKASLRTDGFLSSLSFQETKRVILRTAGDHTLDFLQGLKERLITGQFIEAGTGLYRVPIQDGRTSLGKRQYLLSRVEPKRRLVCGPLPVPSKTTDKSDSLINPKNTSLYTTDIFKMSFETNIFENLCIHATQIKQEFFEIEVFAKFLRQVLNPLLSADSKSYKGFLHLTDIHQSYPSEKTLDKQSLGKDTRSPIIEYRISIFAKIVAFLRTKLAVPHLRIYFEYFCRQTVISSKAHEIELMSMIDQKTPNSLSNSTIYKNLGFQEMFYVAYKFYTLLFIAPHSIFKDKIQSQKTSKFGFKLRDKLLEHPLPNRIPWRFHKHAINLSYGFLDSSSVCISGDQGMGFEFHRNASPQHFFQEFFIIQELLNLIDKNGKYASKTSTKKDNISTSSLGSVISFLHKLEKKAQNEEEILCFALNTSKTENIIESESVYPSVDSSQLSVGEYIRQIQNKLPEHKINLFYPKQSIQKSTEIWNLWFYPNRKYRKLYRTHCMYLKRIQIQMRHFLFQPNFVRSRVDFEFHPNKTKRINTSVNLSKSYLDTLKLEVTYPSYFLTNFIPKYRIHSILIQYRDAGTKTHSIFRETCSMKWNSGLSPHQRFTNYFYPVGQLSLGLPKKQDENKQNLFLLPLELQTAEYNRRIQTNLRSNHRKSQLIKKFLGLRITNLRKFSKLLQILRCKLLSIEILNNQTYNFESQKSSLSSETNISMKETERWFPASQSIMENSSKNFISGHLTLNNLFDSSNKYAIKEYFYQKDILRNQYQLYLQRIKRFSSEVQTLNKMDIYVFSNAHFKDYHGLTFLDSYRSHRSRSHQSKDFYDLPKSDLKSHYILRLTQNEGLKQKLNENYIINFRMALHLRTQLLKHPSLFHFKVLEVYSHLGKKFLQMELDLEAQKKYPFLRPEFIPMFSIELKYKILEHLEWEMKNVHEINSLFLWKCMNVMISQIAIRNLNNYLDLWFYSETKPEFIRDYTLFLLTLLHEN